MSRKLTNIDKFFLSGLKGHKETVSPHLWNEIEKDFIHSYLGRRNFFERTWPLIAVFTAGMISLAIVLNTHQSKNSEITTFTDNENILPADTDENIPTTNKDLINIEDNTVTETNNEIEAAYTADNTSNNTSGKAVKDIMSPTESHNNMQSDQNSEKDVVSEYSDNKEKIILPLHLPLSNYLYFKTFVSPIDETPQGEKLSLKPLTDYNSYYRKADFLLGAHISPAITYYPGGENKNSYAFDITANYNKSDFLVQGGVGAEYYSEKANYSINFRSFDSVGYYYDVTSFAVDPLNPDSIIFNLKSTNIYDSVNHVKIEETSNKYLYMHIPLNIGYTIWENNRFSLNIKGGIIFSWLVYKEEPHVKFEVNDATLVNINNNYPGRRKTNWQWTAGLGINVNISRRMVFSLEPFYKQYINSIYSKGSSMDKELPYSVGIRTGIYLNF